ncbi:MAG: cell division protein ZapE, partial [Steroidobacteraceae bacterium]
MNREAGKSLLAARIEATLAAQGAALDESQRAVVARLEDLRRRALARSSLLARSLELLPRPRTPLRGLYLWGGVGRGKTFLADEFFAELPLREKRREHFHRFMQDVHARLRRHRNRPSPLDQVAAEVAAKARIICIDELAVGDVADAMILGSLFEALFRRGVTLVATSNQPPSELYRRGLQRERFLPAVALIEKHCRVMQLDAGVDYRLRQLERATLWFGPSAA